MPTMPRIEGAEQTVPLAKSIAPAAGPATAEGQGLAYLGQVVEQQSSRAVALSSMFEVRADAINDNNLSSQWGHARVQKMQAEADRIRERMTVDPAADPDQLVNEFNERVKAINDSVDLDMQANGMKDRLLPMSRTAAAPGYETLSRELMQYRRGIIVERAKARHLEEVHLVEQGVAGDVTMKGANFNPSDLMYAFNRVHGTYLDGVQHGIVTAEQADSGFAKSAKVITNNAFAAMPPNQVLEILRDQPRKGNEAEWQVWQNVLQGIDTGDRQAIRKSAQDRLIDENKFAQAQAEAATNRTKAESAVTKDLFEQGMITGKLNTGMPEYNAMLDKMTMEDQKKALEIIPTVSRMRAYPDPPGGDNPERTLKLSVDLIAKPSAWSVQRLEQERKYFTANTWDNKILPLYYSQLEKEKSGVMTYARDLEKGVSDHFKVNPLGASSHFASDAMGYYRTQFWTEYQQLPMADQMNPRKVQALSDGWENAARVRYDQALAQAVDKIYRDYPSMKDKPAASVVRSALLKKMPSYEVDAILEYLEAQDRLGKEPNASSAESSYTGTGK